MTEPDTSSTSAKYPTKRGWKDHALSAGKAVVGAMPYVGPAGNELLSLIAPPLDRARIEFVDDLGERLKKVERVVDEERLASFVFGAVQSAMGTSDQEKRELLRNAALNVAMGRGGDRIDYFRNLIDQLSVNHIRVLRFFAEPHGGKMLDTVKLVEDAAQRVMSEDLELRGQKVGLVEAIVQELWDRRLLPFPRRPPPTLGPDLIDLHTLSGSRLAPLAEEFLEFIRDPLEPSR